MTTQKRHTQKKSIVNEASTTNFPIKKTPVILLSFHRKRLLSLQPRLHFLFFYLKTATTKQQNKQQQKQNICTWNLPRGQYFIYSVTDPEDLIQSYNSSFVVLASCRLLIHSCKLWRICLSVSLLSYPGACLILPLDLSSPVCLTA